MVANTSDHWIELTRKPIHPQALSDFVTTPATGAVVLFLGTVREWTSGQQTLALEYDAYSEMALKVMRALVMDTCERWPVRKIAMIHRLGRLELAEVSIGIAVAAPHRQDAFVAGQFLINELKRHVPIWKKEHWADGSTDWIHPVPDGA